MIDPTTAIEVIVKPMNSARSSEPYHEWKASHKGDQVGVAPNECYIEAVDGERFQIEVVLHPLFSFHGAPEVKIRCRIDGGAAAIDTIMKRPSEWSKSSTAMRTSFDFYYSTVAGFSRKCGFGFSKLAVSDNLDLLSKEEETMEIDNRGKVVIATQRGSTDLRAKRSNPRVAQNNFALPNITNKMVAIDAGRSHAMQPVDPGPPEEIRYTRAFTPNADSTTGGEIKFTLYYTTSEYLERKQIKPLIVRPNTVGHGIVVDDFPDTAVRGKREGSAADEQVAKRVKHVTSRRDNLTDAIDDEDHDEEERVFAYLENRERFIKEEDIRREKGAPEKNVVQAELNVAKVDLSEAELELEFFANEPAHHTLDARRRVIMAKKVVVRLELQLARVEGAE